MKVKILKDLIRRNIMGYDIKTLTAKEDEIVEIDMTRGKKLIEKGLAVEISKEVAQEISEKGSGNLDKTPPIGSEGSGGFDGFDGFEGFIGAETSPTVTIDTPPIDPDDYFTLDAKTITRLRGLGKDEIEAILRKYNIEVDKRHTLPTIQEKLIEMVSISLPKGIATVEDLIKFYNDEFGIILDKANYFEDKLSGLTEDMGVLLRGALSDEDS